MTSATRALCIGRHRFLSDHLGLFFSRIGLTTRTVVGLPAAVAAVAGERPDVIICDYDLLTTIPLDELERDTMFGHVPVLAVSMTRRPDEMQTLDINGIGGFLYLPMADAEATLGVLEMMRRASQYSPAHEWNRPMAAVSTA
jgi:hypothetical protein